MDPEWSSLHFIGEEIEAQFEKAPTLSKKPGPPDRFVWRDTTYRIELVLSSWTDYQRRGRMAKNMKVENLKKASLRGSWGVGRFYFRVQTEGNRVFDLYYDRAPSTVQDRAGHWFLWREMEKG